MNDRAHPSVAPDRAGASTEAAGDAEVDDLVRRSLAGDDDAFAEIFRRYRGKVHRICFRFARDRDEAMDLVQVTFIKAHRSLATYRAESSFTTWLARIATHCGIDHVRARKREGRVDLDETTDVEASARAEAAQGPRGPSALVEADELRRHVATAVDALSEKHRTVFLLHCVEGMSYQAIADTLRISIGTVMSRLFHARRYLRRSLAPYLGEAQVRTLLKGSEPPSERGGDREARPDAAARRPWAR